MKSARCANFHILIVFLFSFFLAAAFFSWAPARPACADSSAIKIKNLQISDDLIRIEIDGAFTYTLYNPDPYKVTIEFPGVSAGSFAGEINPKAKGITSVNVTDNNKATKVDVLLDSPATIKPSFYKDTFRLALIQPAGASATNTPSPASISAEKKVEAGNENAAAAAKGGPQPEPAAQAKSASSEPAAQAASPKINAREQAARATRITGVQFEQEAGGATFVVTGNGALQSGVFSLPNRIVVDFYGVSLGAKVPKEAPLPVTGIRSGSYPDKVRFVIDTRENTTYKTLSSGDTLKIVMTAGQLTGGAAEGAAGNAGRSEMKPAETQAAKQAASTGAETGGPTPRPGQKISLDFENAQIVPIFMLLGQVGGYNVVVHPSVSGTITLKLKDVPWEQALDILLKTFSLGKEIKGNIMTIAPESQFETWAKEKEKLREATQTSEELTQAVVKLNYATASDVTGYITSGKLLSPRGSITTDTRMNTLIIKDTPTQINKIKNLIALIDVAKPQVMIEAQIVEVSSNYTQNLGIKWGGLANLGDNLTADPQMFNWSVNSPVAFAGPGISAGATLNPNNTSATTAVSGTGQPAGAGFFRLGTANSMVLDLSIEALEQINESKVIANPKVLTIDNEAATIMSGQSIPVQTTTAAGTTTTFVNANLNLTVTPRITPNGFVQLQVTASNDTLGTLTPQGYAIDKKNVTTQALVKDGETLVLGGIFKKSENSSSSGIPLLSKIPILGWLFKTRQLNGPNRDELLILITPRIVRPS